jgi:DNA-binding transcriptional LysR family regulator
MTENLDWDNVRYFLAVARAGKLTAAARRLGQDHTTVGRRIATLENAFHSKLFERRPQGYHLTETGQKLYRKAELMESSVWEIQRDLAGCTQQVEGLVRIGAPDDFGSLFLAKHLGKLQRLHLGLKIELIVLPYTLSVSKREVDIAISTERPTEGRLFARRLTDFEMRLYAAREYLDAHGPIGSTVDLSRQLWIGCVNDFNAALSLDSLPGLDFALTPRFTCSSVIGQLAAAVSGAGVSMLPRYAADQEKSLVPILPNVIRATRAYHMIVHDDLRDLPRVRTAANYIAQTAAEARSLFNPSLNRSNQPKASSLPAWLAYEALGPTAAQGQEPVSVMQRLQSAAIAETVGTSTLGDQATKSRN